MKTAVLQGERLGPNQQVCAQMPEVNDHYQQESVALKEQA